MAYKQKQVQTLKCPKEMIFIQVILLAYLYALFYEDEDAKDV